MPLPPAVGRGTAAAAPPASQRGKLSHRNASAWLRLVSSKILLGLLVVVIITARLAMPTPPPTANADTSARAPSLSLVPHASLRARLAHAVEASKGNALQHHDDDEQVAAVAARETTMATASSSLDGDEDSPVAWAFAEVMAANGDGTVHKHNFTPQLPVGARKFCTALDDPDMEVMEPYVGPRDPEEIPNRTVWVDGCSEPVVLLPFQGIKMYPTLKCGALREWKRFHAAAWPRASSLAVLDEHAAVNGGAVHHKGVVHIPPRVGVSVEPPADVIKKCLSLCLDSPCCLTFTLTRHAPTVFACGLHVCDYTRAHHHREAVEPMQGYSYVLAYRREYRPSLVRSEWRIAMHRAPGRVLRLSGPNQSWDDVMRRAAATASGDDGVAPSGASKKPRGPNDQVLFELRTVAEHGTLMQPVHGIARIRARCYGELQGNTLTPHSSTDLMPLKSRHGGSGVVMDVVSPDLRLENGRATSTGSWLDVAVVWQQCVGRWLQLDVNATISRIVPEEALRTPLPDGDDVATLSTTLFSMVHREADAALLEFAPPAAAPRTRFGEVTFPRGTFGTSPKTCAPMLNANECCLNFVFARQVANGDQAAHGDSAWMKTRSARPLAAASSTRLEHSYVVLNVSTRFPSPGPTSGADAGNEALLGDVSCVELVDGYNSHFDEDGIARFTNLVVRVNRHEGRCVQDGVNITIHGHQRFQQEWRGVDDPWAGDAQGVRLPLTWFLGHCGSTETRHRGQLQPVHQGDSLFVVEKSEVKEEEEPILISVPAHECMDCLHSFLQNLRAFVWPSIVVIHFPTTAKMPSPEALAGLNRSHPRTYINTLRIDSVVGVRLLHIHGINIHYALHHLHLTTPFSHALLLASNELFVKHGVVEYMRRYDAVWMHTPSADTGALFEHHGDGRHRWTVQEFKPMEEMLRYPPRKWGFVWPDTIVADHWLAAAMRRRNLTGHPMNTVLLEGTFFRRGIAEEFAKEMMIMFDPFDYCEDPMLYPHCEILGPTVLQNVCNRPGIVCGHRVTTMMWLNDGWTSTVDDIRRVRCSPFEVPFGFKRVPRSMTDRVRVEIARLTTQALVSPKKIRRDVNVTFCRQKKTMSEELL